MDTQNSNRRDFLVGGVSMALAAGISAAVHHTPDSKERDTIRLLRPDGTLVEVDRQVVAGQLEQQLRATNEQVQEWMRSGGDHG